MTSTFDERMKFLGNEVGTGNLVAGVTVDQPYAQDQHETLSYRHSSGRAEYLRAPLQENHEELFLGLAREVITERGSNLEDGMKDVAKDMRRFVEINAPIDTGRLRESPSPWVDDHGVRVWEEPAKASRQVGPSESGWHRR